MAPLLGEILVFRGVFFGHVAPNCLGDFVGITLTMISTLAPGRCENFMNLYPPEKMASWKIPMFNRKYIDSFMVGFPVSC